MALIDSFIERIGSDQTADRKGGNKKCYLFSNYALLVGSFKPEDILYTKTKQAELVDEGVNLFPIIDYKAINEPSDLGYQKGYILQRRAVGEELYHNPSQEKYESTIAKLAAEKPEVFDKFIDDWAKIQSKGITPDPSKSSNFFYDPGKSINFIDVDKGGPGTNNPHLFLEAGTVLLGGGQYYTYGGDANHATQKQAGVILQKLKTSFIKRGWDEKALEACINKSWPKTQSQKAVESRSISQSKEYDIR